MHAASLETSRRVLLRNIRWEVYEALMDARGDDPSPLFTYDRGDLEIRAPLARDERLKCLTRRLIQSYTEVRGIDIKSVGATTLLAPPKRRGLEPDDSYYVQNEPLVRGKDDFDITVDPPPDLAVEIDITSSSLDKLAICASLGVPEIWTYDDGLIMYSVSASGQPVVLEKSKALPDLAPSDLVRFLEMRQSRSETQLVRAFREWVRERHGAE